MHPATVASFSLSSLFDIDRLVAAEELARRELIAERTVGGHWVGELSGSPIATAAALSALVIAHGNGSVDLPAEPATAAPNFQSLVQSDLSELIVESLHWLASRQNVDGGWSDAEHGRTSVAATLMVLSAFRLTGVPAKYEDLTERADKLIESQGGIAALRKYYGRDKTCLTPILANAALAGLVPWRQVPALPFELLSLPRGWQPRLKLPTVSFALPLLAAMGQLKFHHDPPRNPLVRGMRMAARAQSLAIVERAQPASGGFLESIPLTAFVVMGLAGMGLEQHPVVRRGVEFLLASVRSNASWPVMSNQATRNSALAIEALVGVPAAAHFSYVDNSLRAPEPIAATAWDDTRADLPGPLMSAHGEPTTLAESHSLDEKCIDWLLDCQQQMPNAQTGAPAGGWSGTELPGGLPESNDTANVLLALARLPAQLATRQQQRLQAAASRGTNWLLAMQNDDGGWPTFCVGWSFLDADRSASDVTAQAIRALAAWRAVWRGKSPRTTVADGLLTRIDAAIDRGVSFLSDEQHSDGSFVPLWFGNPYHVEGRNLVCGTALVLKMCAELGRLDTEMAKLAAAWLIGVQHANGGWGPPRTSPATSLSNTYRSGSSRAEDALASFCSVEETSLAVEALLPLAPANQIYARAVGNGLKWLVEAVEQGKLRQSAPIGVDFAKLWYGERLYPLVFATGVLRRAAARLAPQHAVAISAG